MIDNKELEEGEIIDISDTDSPQRLVSHSESITSTTTKARSLDVNCIDLEKTNLPSTAKLILQCVRKSPVSEKVSPRRGELDKNVAMISTEVIKISSDKTVKTETKLLYADAISSNELDSNEASISLFLSDKENNQSIQNEMDGRSKENILSEKEDLEILFARHELIRQQLEKRGENLDLTETIALNDKGSGLEKNEKISLKTQPIDKNIVSDDAQDMDELLFRHELIKQQLTLVTDVPGNSSESIGGEKSKRKKKGKKRKKTNVCDSTTTYNVNPLLSPISPPADKRTVDVILPKEDQINARIDKELFTIRKEASKLPEKTEIVGISSSKKVPKKLKIKTASHVTSRKEKVKDHHSFNKFSSLNVGSSEIKLSKSALKRRKRRARKLRMANLAQLPRSGKNANISYSEQQESEVKLLQSQQEAFDNYTNIPMEIEDDDTSINPSDFAPLPLIEMPEVRPPSPPREFEEFKPVADQATLRMTRSNVAWMPGFVESLDIDFSVASPKTEHVENIPTPQVIKIDETTHVKKEEEEEEEEEEEVVQNEDDDADVWALRAQALKSLACKRAVRAKKLNKSKKSKAAEGSSEPPKESVPKLQDIVTPEIQSPVTPVNIKSFDTIVKKKKTLYNKNPPPPKHPCVIIPLRAEDFESSSESEEEFEKSQEVRAGIVRTINRRRKAASDETLLRDLQSHIKRCRLRMKKNSSSIVKDQLFYKKLHNEISKQKILFEEQKEHCKKLQEELQLALKQKSTTSKTYNKLSGQFKELKDQLKEKIQVRNTTDEKILRAKSIVSVNRLRSNNPKNNARLKFQISSLIESLKTSYHALVTTDKTSALDPNSLESSLNEIESDASEIIEQFNAQRGLSATSKVNSPKDVVEILDSPSEDVVSSDKPNYEPEITQYVPGDVVTINNLLDLKRYYDVRDKDNIETSGTTYTLSELLQGLGSDVSHREIEIIDENESLTIKSEISTESSDRNFVSYKSPLSCFKSYRLSPKFITNSNFSLRSATFSNEIHPNMTICHYDLLGTCNDNNCSRSHLDEKCIISTHSLINDLLSYQLNVPDANGKSTESEKKHNIDLYTNQFMKKYGGKSSLDKTTPLLWKQLSEFCTSKKNKIVDHINLDDRTWFNQDKGLLTENAECKVDCYNTMYGNFPKQFYMKKRKRNGFLISKNENQEIRYFSKKYDSIELLKKRLGENPADVKLWLTLVQQILNTDANVRKSSGTIKFEKLSSNTREYALSVLSQALEENTCSAELWIKYLKLFSLNHSAAELRELCYQAVMFAADYDVWWTCLSLEKTFSGKIEVCSEMITFIKDGDWNNEKKSHYLTETILFNVQLLISCERFHESILYLELGLGITLSPVDEHIKIKKEVLIDSNKFLNRKDKSLLWLCLISVHAFKNIPRCIFSIEESGPGGLINKEDFLLDWQDGKLDCSEGKIRSLFIDALCINMDMNVLPLTDFNILYENVVAFELSLGNIEYAISVLRKVLNHYPSFVDGWRLLMLLNFQFFPTSEVISIGEEAIRNCGAVPKLVYYFCKELLKRNLPELSLKMLKKCVCNYYRDDSVLENSTVVELSKRVIRSFISLTDSSVKDLESTNPDDVVYYCLCYCLLANEKLQTPISCIISTSEAFEFVIHQYHTPKNVKSLWIRYIEYRTNLLSSTSLISGEEYQSFIDLLFQGLASVPAIGVIRENPNLFWRDYDFHNKLVDMCLSIIPMKEHSKLYQKLINFMPDNVSLALRICKHELERDNQEQVKVMCNSLLSEFPNCLQLWKMTFKVESKDTNVKECRWLLQEATKALPFCLSLWRERLKFEAYRSVSFDNVKDSFGVIKEEASIYGINLNEIIPNL